MNRRFIAVVFAGLLVSCGAVRCAVADDAHGHAPAADAHGPATAAAVDDHGHAAADGHAVDYNQAPLPGSAPGLGTLFVFSLVLFGGFVFAARTLVWSPLIAALDQRESRINSAHADAEAAKHEAEHLLAQHSARMAQVHEQVQGIVAQARKEAEQEKGRIIAEAEAAARQLRDAAVADIHAARQSALAQLEGNLDAQVSRAVQHVVGHG